MPKVYSAVKGLKVRIDVHGEATFDIPVEVTEQVAKDVEKDTRVRVVRDVPEPKLKKKDREV